MTGTKIQMKLSLISGLQWQHKERKWKMYSQRMADVIKMCRKIANGMIGNGLIKLTLACLLTPSLASAQRGELTAFGGWQFGGHLGVREGELRLQANENFGGMLNLDVRPGIQLELS
ncbi:MAG: hypothetical protein ACE1ZO_06865 [Nitrospirales bacterium]